MPFACFWLAATVLSGSAVTAADDPVYSGPQPGEKIAAFKVLQFAGPHAGEDVQLLASDKGFPTLLIFVHEVTRPAFQLLRPLDAYAARHADDGLRTHFIWLTADRSKTEDWLRTARNSLNLQSPVSISLDGIEGPGGYGLNRKVTLTILTAKAGVVTSSFAIVQPNETDAPRVIGEVAKILGKPAPTAEELRTEFGVGRREAMSRPAAAKAAERPGTADQAQSIEQQIARLQSLDQEHHARAIARIAELEKLVGDLIDALNDSRAKIAKLEGSPAPTPIKKPARAESGDATGRPAETPKQSDSLPGRTPSDPDLIALMRRMIQPTNDESAVQEIVAAMRSWAGDSSQRKADLRDFAIRIAHLGYGSDAAKPVIKKLAAE